VPNCPLVLYLVPISCNRRNLHSIKCVSVSWQHKELIEDVKCGLFTVDILRPSLYNRVLRAVIHHSADCSEIHCVVPWCYFFSRRYFITFIILFLFINEQSNKPRLKQYLRSGGTVLVSVCWFVHLN